MGKRGYADAPWIFKGNALYQLNLVRYVPDCYRYTVQPRRSDPPVALQLAVPKTVRNEAYASAVNTISNYDNCLWRVSVPH